MSRWKWLIRVGMYLSASGRRTGHISLWPLLQALHIHAIHHTSQAWLCLQLQNRTRNLCHLLVFVYLIHIHATNMDVRSPTHPLHRRCQKQTVHWCCFVKWDVLHVHAWVEQEAEDCGEVSGRLGRDLVCVHPEASLLLLHTWNLVAWIGSLYCWNSRGTGCGET